MLVNIKHILITVKTLKKGFTIRIDKMFGIIDSINGDTAEVLFVNDTRKTYTVEELKYCVVKFLAVMKDLNTFPVVHGDFYKLIYFFNDEGRMEKLLHDKEFTIEGSLENILAYPNVNDIVEIISLELANKHNLLKERTSRIGTIISTKKDGSSDGKFIVKFPTKTIPVKRSEFKILDGINAKQVFRIKE